MTLTPILQRRAFLVRLAGLASLQHVDQCEIRIYLDLDTSQRKNHGIHSLIAKPVEDLGQTGAKVEVLEHYFEAWYGCVWNPIPDLREFRPR
jgi:hypothetical protein